MGNLLPKSFCAPGIHPDSTVRGPLDCEGLLTESYVQGFESVDARFSAINQGRSSFSFSRSAVSVGFGSLVVAPFLQLDSSWAQCLIMGVCFCFHQLLDEGSMMVDKLVINLIIREG